MNTPSIWKFRASLIAAFLAVAPLSPALHAQRQQMQVKVNVPFAFESGARHYTAGVYTVRMENQHTMVIQGSSESGLAMAQVADDSQPAKKGKAVFQRHGNQYFLSEIWVAGKSEHLYFPGSKADSKLQIAGNGTAPTEVELAVLETAR
jgi:hypothetical protein